LPYIKTTDGSLVKPKMAPMEFPKMCISCENSDGSTIYWQQPLIFDYDLYASSLINDWDGNFTIDEDEGQLLTRMLGAGSKGTVTYEDGSTANNVFSGVLMGTLKNTENATGTSGTGIYGFYGNRLRFLLDEKARFFVGTGADNYLSFNNGADFGAAHSLYINVSKIKIQAGTNSSTATNSNYVLLDSYHNNLPYLQLGNKFIFNKDGTATLGPWELTTKAFGSKVERDDEGNITKYGTGMSRTDNPEDVAIWAGYKRGDNKLTPNDSGTNGVYDSYFSVLQDGTVYATKMQIGTVTEEKKISFGENASFYIGSDTGTDAQGKSTKYACLRCAYWKAQDGVLDYERHLYFGVRDIA
jgi:hypothetical protein